MASGKAERMPASTDETRLFKNRQLEKAPVEAILDWVIVGWLALLFAVAMFGFAGAFPPTRVHLAWMMGVLLALHGVALFLAGNRERKFSAVAFLFLPFVVYVYLSAELWAPAPWLGWREAYIYTWTAIALWMVLYHVDDRYKAWALIGTICLVGLVVLITGFYQSFTNEFWLPWGRVQVQEFVVRASGTIGAPNQFGFFMLTGFLVALVFALAPRLGMNGRIGFGYLAVLFVIGVILSASRGTWLAMFGAIALLPYLLLGSLRSRLIGYGALLVAGAIGIGVLMSTVELFEKRVDQTLREGGEWTRPLMWQAAWDIFLEHPVLGSGGGSYDVVFENVRPPQLQKRPLYAHGDYLNMLSDYGAVGFLLFFGPGLYLGWRFWRGWADKPFRVLLVREGREVMPTSKVLLAASLCVLAALAAHLVVEFHLKVPGMLLLFALMAGMAANLSIRPRLTLPANRPARWVAGAIAVALGVVLAVGGVRAFVADSYYLAGFEGRQKWFANFRAYREQPEAIEKVLTDLESAFRWDPAHGDAIGDYGYALLQSWVVSDRSREELASEALVYLDQALDLSKGIWRFHAYRGMALWVSGAPPEEARQEYQKAVALAPNRPQGWWYYADFLAWYPEWREEALDALEQVLRLDPKHARALQKRRILLAP